MTVGPSSYDTEDLVEFRFPKDLFNRRCNVVENNKGRSSRGEIIVIVGCHFSFL